MGKAVRLTGEFKIEDLDAAIAEVREVIADLLEVKEWTSMLLELGPSTVNFPVPLGGLDSAKRIFFRVSGQPPGQTGTVLARFNSPTDAGFELSGFSLFSGKVNTIFLTTGSQGATVKITMAA